MSFLESELLIKINHSSNDVLIPKKMYVNSAGHDLFASQTINVHAGSRALVSIELRMAIPKGIFWSNFFSFWPCSESWNCCF